MGHNATFLSCQLYPLSFSAYRFPRLNHWIALCAPHPNSSGGQPTIAIVLLFVLNIYHIEDFPDVLIPNPVLLRGAHSYPSSCAFWVLEPL